jgi:hypothetical protein
LPTIPLATRIISHKPNWGDEHDKYIRQSILNKHDDHYLISFNPDKSAVESVLILFL